MPDILCRATLPATVGEWVQGWVGESEALVSLVVAWKGCVELCGSNRLLPVDRRLRSKALAAFERARALFGEARLRGCRVRVRNPHPVAMGLATSTMDTAGVFASCAALAGEEMSEEKLFSLCAELEPSDGIMFEGLALVDHLNGRLLERLPAPPDMEMVVLLPERSLDTADYRSDSARMKAVKTLAREHREAYDMLKKGLSRGDAALVAEASSRSAELQQLVMPRCEWPLLAEAKASFGALGVAVAHSGTASALLFGENSREVDAAKSWIKDGPFGRHIALRQVSVAGGGFLAERFPE